MPPPPPPPPARKGGAKNMMKALALQIAPSSSSAVTNLRPVAASAQPLANATTTPVAVPPRATAVMTPTTTMASRAAAAGAAPPKKTEQTTSEKVNISVDLVRLTERAASTEVQSSEKPTKESSGHCDAIALPSSSQTLNLTNNGIVKGATEQTTKSSTFEAAETCAAAQKTTPANTAMMKFTSVLTKPSSAPEALLLKSIGAKRPACSNPSPAASLLLCPLSSSLASSCPPRKRFPRTESITSLVLSQTPKYSTITNNAAKYTQGGVLTSPMSPPVVLVPALGLSPVSSSPPPPPPFGVAHRLERPLNAPEELRTQQYLKVLQDGIGALIMRRARLVASGVIDTLLSSPSFAEDGNEGEEIKEKGKEETEEKRTSANNVFTELASRVVEERRRAAAATACSSTVKRFKCMTKQSSRTPKETMSGRTQLSASQRARRRRSTEANAKRMAARQQKLTERHAPHSVRVESM